MLAVLLFLTLAADEAETIRLLREKGVKITESQGTATAADVGDCSKWTDEDFRQVAALPRLKSLSFGPGLRDSSLALLAGLSELESLSTNLSLITDGGAKGLAGFKSLKIVKFFHPCKEFSGAGLAALAEMTTLERLTVAGSLAFNDEGMSAVGKLTRLKEFRTWHAGQTIEGVKKLKDLPNLKSLTLGQRLAYKPPTTVSDETIAVLAEMRPLETLQLEEARLTREALARLKALPGLKKLILAGIDIAEPEIERLRQDLRGVDVQWTKCPWDPVKADSHGPLHSPSRARPTPPAPGAVETLQADPASPRQGRGPRPRSERFSLQPQDTEMLHVQADLPAREALRHRGHHRPHRSRQDDAHVRSHRPAREARAGPSLLL
jgi:hypothetical protein